MSDNRKPLILMYAREYRQAEVFARHIGLRKEEWHFLDNPRRIMGLNSFVVIMCGQFRLDDEGAYTDKLLEEYEKLGRCTILKMRHI